MKKVILSLGSNMGDKKYYLNSAIDILEQKLTDIKISDIYQSKALLLEGSPKEWDQDFYNIAVSGYTELTPDELLEFIKKIEQQLGRTNRGRWAPREIDIDILGFEDLILDTPTLTIPHKELLNRDFFVIPFAEIEPSWIVPELNKTIKEIRDDKNFCSIKSNH